MLVVLALAIAACTSAAPAAGTGGGDAASVNGAQGQVGDIVVEGAWARPAEQGGTTAVYLLIRNTGEEADALIDVAAPAVTDEAMLHESKMVDNVMMMDHVHQIDLPPGETVELKVGGLHIMLMEAKSELQPGDTVTVTLHFAQAGALALEAPVLEQ